MGPAREQVRELLAKIRECLAALDLAEPQNPEVGRAFEQLNLGFEALGDPAALLRDAAPQERDRMEGELSELARLHAVLTATVSRDKDRLCALLERSRAARVAMASTPAGVPTGETLDFEA